MEGLSVTAVWLALVTAGASSVLFAAQAIGLRVVLRRLATAFGEGPLVAAVETGEGNGRGDVLGRYSVYASWLTTGLLVLAMAARWQAAGHAPWSNMYEFTVAFAGCIAGSYVVFERAYGPRNSAVRSLGLVAMPTVLVMLAVALAFFPSQVRPLVPALQNSNLLAIHVAAMVLAYGALSVSFLAASLYLIQGGSKNRFSRLPKAALLDEVAYKSVMIGFPLLAAGIALGAYWANSAWGRYWGWDPKETSALATLLVYGVYLHMRPLRKWSGTASAWVLVAAFGAVLFTYFAVNLWVSGLHSYAGV
jgi:cytochrome c-type biogenesis protein CcsB